MQQCSQSLPSAGNQGITVQSPDHVYRMNNGDLYKYYPDGRINITHPMSDNSPIHHTPIYKIHHTPYQQGGSHRSQYFYENHQHTPHTQSAYTPTQHDPNNGTTETVGIGNGTTGFTTQSGTQNEQGTTETEGNESGYENADIRPPQGLNYVPDNPNNGGAETVGIQNETIHTPGAEGGGGATEAGGIQNETTDTTGTESGEGGAETGGVGNETTDTTGTESGEGGGMNTLWNWCSSAATTLFGTKCATVATLASAPLALAAGGLAFVGGVSGGLIGGASGGLVSLASEAGKAEEDRKPLWGAFKSGVCKGATAGAIAGAVGLPVAALTCNPILGAGAGLAAGAGGHYIYSYATRPEKKQASTANSQANAKKEQNTRKGAAPPQATKKVSAAAPPGNTTPRGDNDNIGNFTDEGDTQKEKFDVENIGKNGGYNNSNSNINTNDWPNIRHVPNCGCRIIKTYYHYRYR